MNKEKVRVAVLVMGVLFCLTGRVVAADLVETGKVIPSDKFPGRVADAYKRAAEIPQTLDGLYCYCKCKENASLKHKTLLTCYTNDHASKCEICLKEAEIAGKMTAEGKTMEEIRAAVDEYGARVLQEAKDKEKGVAHEHHH